MRGECERCVHFRPQRRLAEILRLQGGKDVAQAFQTVMQMDPARLSEEEGWKVQLMPDREQWPFKPWVVEYCGLKEDEDVYLVSAIKNGDGCCEDFVPDHDQLPRPCETCVYREAASGPAQDHQNLKDAISPALNFYQDADGRSRSGAITSDLQTLMQVSQGQQTEEMLTALYNGGTMPIRPRYYSYCRKYSNHNKYVLCRWQNPHNRCRGWSGHSMGGPETHTGQNHGQNAPPMESPAHGGAREESSSSGEFTFFRDLARRIAEELKRR